MATSVLEDELGKRKRSAVQPMAVRQPPGAAGLRNFAGDAYGTQAMLDAFRVAQESSQGTALQPTVAAAAPSAPAAPGGSLLDTWRNGVPTGPQYPTAYGRPDPQSTFDPNDPVPHWIGNFPRYGMNAAADVVSAVPEIGWELAKGVGSAAMVPIEAYRYLTTSANERARQDQAAAPEVAPEPVRPQYQLQPDGGLVPSSIPPSATPNVTSLIPDPNATPTPPGPTTGPAAVAPAQPQPSNTQYTTPAQAGAWNTLPPAALQMAQEFQRMGYDPLRIAGILGQAGGESSFQPGVVGDSGTSHGLFQHHAERAVARQQYADARGLDVNDPTTEARFLNWELQGEVDPRTGQRSGGTESYAYQQLLAAQDPYGAAAAGLHFERPQGYSRAPGQFNPQAVSGWWNRANTASQIYNLLSNNPLPPSQQGYNATPAPPLPNPVDRPTPQQPDYGVMNDWLNKAAPQPVDPQAQRQMVFNNMLSQIALRNADTDVSGPGAVGRLIAGWGAGAAGGKAVGEERARIENERFKQATEGYAMDRARFAQTQENANVNWRQQRDETLFSNAADDQRIAAANQQALAATEEGNRQRDYTAGQANEENIYNWQLEAKKAQTPVQKFTEKGVWTIQPDGSMSFTSSGEGESGLERATKIGALKDPDFRDIYTYGSLLETGNTNLLRDRMMRDVFERGMGESVFEGNYTAIREEEASKVDRANVNLKIQKPVEYEAQVNTAVMQRLKQMFKGDDTWIERAADQGLYGPQQFLLRAKRVTPKPAQASASGKGGGGF